MPRANHLRIVEPLAVSEGKPVDPERRLRALFRTEARIERELANVRREVSAERERYRTKHFLLMLPGIDGLRRQFGPKAEVQQ